MMFNKRGSIDDFIDIHFPDGIPDSETEQSRRQCRDFLRSVLVLSRQAENQFPSSLLTQIDRALKSDRNLVGVTSSVRDYMDALAEFDRRRPRL